MTIAVPKESISGERRVALVQDSVTTLKKSGLDVWIESGAGAAAFYIDAAYEKAGATIAPEQATLLSECDVLAKVQRPTVDEVARMREGVALISFLQPMQNLDVVGALNARRV